MEGPEKLLIFEMMEDEKQTNKKKQKESPQHNIFLVGHPIVLPYQQMKASQSGTNPKQTHTLTKAAFLLTNLNLDFGIENEISCSIYGQTNLT